MGEARQKPSFGGDVELGNELQQYSNLPFNDWGVTAYKLQKELLHRYDDTRLTTVAMHPRYRNLETDSIPADLAIEMR